MISDGWKTFEVRTMTHSMLKLALRKRDSTSAVGVDCPKSDLQVKGDLMITKKSQADFIGVLQ